MRRRREAQSSTLSFMDCICCGFGAILLLFILTAKRQLTLSAEEIAQRVEAVSTLEVAIEAAETRDRELRDTLDATGPPPGEPDATELAAEEARLRSSVAELQAEVEALRMELESSDEPAALDRPSADRSYLAGLRLRGPRVLILLERSGSMAAENATDALAILRAGKTLEAPKWRRAKAAVRSVLAALPKDTTAAVYAFAETAAPLSGDSRGAWFDPYENSGLLTLLTHLEELEAAGGADLAGALQTVASLRPAPTSILLIGDGLPTAPTAGGALSEADRIALFRRATAVQPNIPFNALLLPFAGDPAAAGLFWQMTGRTLGVTVAPDAGWPPMN